MAAQELGHAGDELHRAYRGVLRHGWTQLTITNLPANKYVTYPLLKKAFGDAIGYFEEMENWDHPGLPIMDIYEDEVIVMISKEFTQKLLELQNPIKLGGKNLKMVCFVL